MNPTAIQPVCNYEDVTAEGIVDGLQTISGKTADGVVVHALGNGPDEPINWAIREIAQARVESGTERNRLITNAVMNSRRALACLSNWYMARDLVDLCSEPASTPKQQAEYLTRRNVIDDLTAHVLERAIGDRNRVEHDFTVTTLERAEDVVELLRRIISTLRANSDPAYGPMICGSYLGGWGMNESGYYSTFQGWIEPIVVFSRYSSIPWVGIVIPDNKTTATVRRAFLNCINRDQLLSILTLTEQKFGSTTSYLDPMSSHFRLKSIGLLT